jgi:hypothetical protein
LSVTVELLPVPNYEALVRNVYLEYFEKLVVFGFYGVVSGGCVYSGVVYISPAYLVDICEGFVYYDILIITKLEIYFVSHLFFISILMSRLSSDPKQVIPESVAVVYFYKNKVSVSKHNTRIDRLAQLILFLFMLSGVKVAHRVSSTSNTGVHNYALYFVVHI